MEDVFKQNLLNLRQAEKPLTFGDALFPNSLWKPMNKRIVPVPAKVLISEDYSEKKQVLESFERFAQEKLDTMPASTLKIEGGELGFKAIPSWDAPDLVDLPALLNSLTIAPEFIQLLFKEKTPEKIKVIFVTENFRSWEEASKELKTGFINELLSGFPPKTAEFFERMIMAMKLLPEEVILYPVDNEDKDLTNEVISITSLFRPEVIITLGAKAAHRILNVKDRLNGLHGQFFPRTLEGGYTFQVIPLYHPSIIETNQNMKKTAWTDMQKIMKHLKKLS